MKHALLALLLGAGACSHPVAPSTTHPAGVADAPHPREVAAPRVCLAKRRLLEALGKTSLAAEASQPSTRTEQEPATPRPPAPPIQDAYRIAAPTTVLIRTPSGMGSGVVIDAKRGLVLTNHHVVGDQLDEDLTIHLTLELGKPTATGRMLTSGEKLEGVVVKSDAVKDLAIVKILHPPATLVAAKISEFDPRVGENVMSIGNAGIGLLWAAKVCNVSKVGDLTRETSMLEAGDCARTDATRDADERKHSQEQCQARKDEIRKEVETAPQMLSVQTTCGINGGDSGGPLVNAWGEVVGLNQSVRMGANALAFHVHVAEIREMVRDISDTPVTVVPDVYCDGGAHVTVDDFDGDGVIDSASSPSEGFEGGEVVRQGTYLFDLDQDTSKPITAEHPFYPEIALVMQHGDAFAFYDTDGDGAFDLMLRDSKADGTAERAYHLTATGAVLDRSMTGKTTLDPSLVAKGSHAMLARLGAAASGLGLSKLTTAEALASAEVPPVPDFVRAFGDEGFAQDGDGDGQVETIYAMSEQMNHQAMLFDVRSKALLGLKSGDAAGPALKAGEIHPQYVFLERPAGSWALYDLDANGTFDLALFAKRAAPDGPEQFSRTPDYVTHAFTLAPGKPPVPIRDPIGRSLTRVDLFVDASVRKAFEQSGAGRRAERGGFPDPLEGAGGMSEPWKLSPLEKDRQVLEQHSRAGHVALVDLDRDTKKIATRTAAELARPHEFDAEIAIIRSDDLGWFFYDTDGDGAYDTVTFTRTFATGIADNMFKLDPTGEKVTVMPAGGPAFLPDLVHASPKAKEKLTALVAEMAVKPPPLAGKGKGKGTGGSGSGSEKPGVPGMPPDGSLPPNPFNK